MALRVYWTKRADKKFDQIIDYLLENWGARVTQSFIRKLYDTIDILVEYPEIGTIENLEKGIYGFTIIKQVNIFYRIKGKKLIILTLFDNRQHPKKKKL